MPDNTTIISQGSFTSTGVAVTLNIPSDVDWMEVLNYTQMGTTASPGVGVKYEWYRGFPAGGGIEYSKTASTNALNGTTLSSGGFTVIDGPQTQPGALVTGTTITKAAPPVCTATAHGYSNGQVVRIIDSDNMAQINGVPFTIGSVSANTFTLAYMNTNTANFTAATSFTVRSLPSSEWKPQRYYVTAITKANSAVITLSVAHSLSVNDVVRIQCPSVWGMTEINNTQGTITAIDATNNTITVNINSSAFTTFAWPPASDVPLTWAQVIPVGITGSNSLDDATSNQNILGMTLGAGANGPAGANADLIYWKAGKSINITP